jgi:hypothetical protein
MKNKTHSPTGECDRPENTFYNSVLWFQTNLRANIISEEPIKTEKVFRAKTFPQGMLFRGYLFDAKLA